MLHMRTHGSTHTDTDTHKTHSLSTYIDIHIATQIHMTHNTTHTQFIHTVGLGAIDLSQLPSIISSLGSKLQKLELGRLPAYSADPVRIQFDLLQVYDGRGQDMSIDMSSVPEGIKDLFVSQA